MTAIQERGTIRSFDAERLSTPFSPEFQFDPDGMLWKINRENATFLGGPSALTWQIMNRQVGSALIKTGELERDPLSRLRQNAIDGLGMIFGTPQEYRDYKERVFNAHARFGVHSLPDGTAYSPFTQEGQGIVASALIIGSIEGYQAGVGTLEPEERNQYLAESKQLFAPELRPTTLPDTYEDLLEQRQEWQKSGVLQVTDETRRLHPYTMLSHTLPKEFAMTPIRLVTFAMLPPEIRRELGQNLSPNQLKTAEAFLAGIKKLVPHLPEKARYTKEYLRAQGKMEELAKAE